MIRSSSFAVLAALAAITLPQTAAAQCIPGGPGGALPATGTGGGGTFSTVLPPSPFQQSPAVPVPAGATVLKSVQITGLPDDLRRFDDPDLIPAWQAAGGKIEIVRINGTDGEDLIDASGTLTLDANRMPEGEITYANRGISERLAPYVNPVVLSVLAGLPQEDGTLKQALQFSGGALRVGGIPLFNLEPLF